MRILHRAYTPSRPSFASQSRSATAWSEEKSSMEPREFFTDREAWKQAPRRLSLEDRLTKVVSSRGPPNLITASSSETLLALDMQRSRRPTSARRHTPGLAKQTYSQAVVRSDTRSRPRGRKTRDTPTRHRTAMLPETNTER